MKYCCPVCMYDALPYPPTDYHICPCCGTEFGNDDEDFSHEQLREMWIASGAHWFFGNPPPDWNWRTQLCGPEFIIIWAPQDFWRGSNDSIKRQQSKCCGV